MAIDVIGEVGAVEPLHGEVDDVVGDAVVEDLDGVGAVEACNGLDFPLEAGDVRAFCGELVTHDLEGYGAGALDVLSLVDGAHAAAGDKGEDLVSVGDQGAGQESIVCVGRGMHGSVTALCETWQNEQIRTNNVKAERNI